LALGFLILQFSVVLIIQKEKEKEKLLLELWNSLVCVDCLNFKSLALEGLQFKLDSGNFDFIKISTQITNKFSKVRQNDLKKIYAEINE
jgi:hypothetical protein